MRLQSLIPLFSLISLSACVLRKNPENILQFVPDSGVSYPKDAASDLGLSEDLVKRVYSKQNLLEAQAQLPSDKGFELNILLRGDWQTRLPFKLNSGDFKTYEDLQDTAEITAIGDVPVLDLQTNPAPADSLRKMSAVRKTPVFDLMKVRISEKTIPQLISALNKLHKHSAVLFAEPNFKNQKVALPNDPNMPSLWGMTKISAPSAWDSFKGNESVVVAVIDTGVNLKHPDLKDNLWKNNRETAGNGIDDDGNGYIDDVNGWDFAYGDNDPGDVDGHGSHCSGTIAARGNNALGVTGVNWVSRIMPVKVLDDSGSGYNYDIYNGIMYAIANGAKVTSNSYGGGGASSLIASAIKAAQDAGVMFVAAAGNESASSASYPAYFTKTYNNVISVASTDSNDTLSSFSNYGDGVDVAAPGRGILSTSVGQNYVTLSGTSMATPHVAGMAAFLWAASPSKSLSEVRAAIVNNSDAVAALSGKVAANGRVNLKASLDALGGVVAPTPTPTATPSPSPTPMGSPTPLPTTFPTPIPTATAAPSPTPSPTVSPTPVPTSTAAPLPTPTPTITPTPTPIPTPVPTPNFGNGLRYRIYRGFWMRLPNFDGLNPVQQGTTSVISTAPSGFERQFGMVFDGLIWVPSDGEYQFFLRSDDGSRLTIKGQRVINHDGLHSMSERTGKIALTAGFHSFRLDYFQLFGGKGLQLQWQGPNFSRRILSTRGVIFHTRER